MHLRKVSWCKELVNIPGVAYIDYEKETAFQTYCADWIRKQFVVTGDPCFDFWHHSANEGGGIRRGFIVKMMGQSKGYPDLVQHSLKLAIELKVGKGKPSEDQLKWLRHFKSIGYGAFVIYSFDAFKDIVLKTKEKKQAKIAQE